MQSLNGGTSYYRANPLVLIVRLTYASSKITPTVLFNPMNKSVSATRSGTGIYTITHNLGHTNYSVLGSCVNTNAMYVTVYTISTNSVVIHTSDDSTLNEIASADIFFYDYQTFKS